MSERLSEVRGSLGIGRLTFTRASKPRGRPLADFDADGILSVMSCSADQADFPNELPGASGDVPWESEAAYGPHMAHAERETMGSVDFNHVENDMECLLSPLSAGRGLDRFKERKSGGSRWSGAEPRNRVNMRMLPSLIGAEAGESTTSATAARLAHVQQNFDLPEDASVYAKKVLHRPPGSAPAEASSGMHGKAVKKERLSTGRGTSQEERLSLVSRCSDPELPETDAASRLQLHGRSPSTLPLSAVPAAMPHGAEEMTAVGSRSGGGLLKMARRFGGKILAKYTDKACPDAADPAAPPSLTPPLRAPDYVDGRPDDDSGDLTRGGDYFDSGCCGDRTLDVDPAAASEVAASCKQLVCPVSPMSPASPLSPKVAAMKRRVAGAATPSAGPHR
jgi:hypothetical protein